MPKKNWGLTLVMLLSLLLAACGESNDTSLKLSDAAQATPPDQAGSIVFATPNGTPGSDATPTPEPDVTPLATGNRPAEKVAIGYSAPDFTLQSLQAKAVKLSQYRGKPVVINFWATWCGPCKAELPLLQKTYAAAAGKFELVGVDVGEEEPLVRLKVKEVGLSYPNLLDRDMKVTTLYQVRGYPTSFFLDKTGVISSIQPGSLTESVLQPKLDKILK